MIWTVTHRTRFSYARSVDLGTHMLHLTPRTLPSQRVLRVEIVADPAPVRLHAAEDHYGNTVTWLSMDRPHASFEVVATTLVDRMPRPPRDLAPPWEVVVAEAREHAAWQAAEFLFDSPLAPLVPEAAGYAAASFPAGRGVLDGALDLACRIAREFAFRPGTTTISTPVSQVIARRQGVCQDFAQAMISGLRGLGLPARYVSGYIRTYPAPGQPRLRGADASHAWVGVWMGHGLGWVDLDPTNACLVGDEHVVLAWGRDYADVSPVRGVILGGGAHAMEVGVDLEPCGPETERGLRPDQAFDPLEHGP
jgi:transglutaminase-like putative cysteine protease